MPIPPPVTSSRITAIPTSRADGDDDDDSGGGGDGDNSNKTMNYYWGWLSSSSLSTATSTCRMPLQVPVPPTNVVSTIPTTEVSSALTPNTSTTTSTTTHQENPSGSNSSSSIQQQQPMMIMMLWWQQQLHQISSYLYNSHPGHVCVLSSMPLFLHAYRGYKYHPLSSSSLSEQPITLQVLKQQPQPGAVLLAEESTLVTQQRNRTMGWTVASRALRVATSGMVGTYLVGIGILFYSTNTTSVAQLLHTIQSTSRRIIKRTYFDDYGGSATGSPTGGNSTKQQQRFDEHHPEYIKLQTMTEEEELEYVYQTYFVNTDDDNNDASDHPTKNDETDRITIQKDE